MGEIKFLKNFTIFLVKNPYLGQARRKLFLNENHYYGVNCVQNQAQQYFWQTRKLESANTYF